MLIRVALRNPHLLTSQALRQPHTCPRQPHPGREDRGVRAPWKGSQLRPRKYAAWKPGSGRPWIALSRQRLKEGDLLYAVLKDPTNT